MQRDSEFNGKTTADSSAARPRRLGVEKLELRSLLAAVAGLPENLAPLSEIEFTSLLNDRPRLQSIGPGVIAHALLTPGSLETSPGDIGESSNPVSFEIADHSNWTNLGQIGQIAIGRGRIIEFDSLDIIHFDSAWKVQTRDLWPPFWRELLPKQVPEVDYDLDQPVHDIPWENVNSNPDSGATGNSGESSGSDPIGSHPEPAPPSSIATPERAGPDKQLQLPWLEFEVSASELTEFARHVSPHSTSSRSDKLSATTASLFSEVDDHQVLGLEDEQRQTDDQPTTEGLLELPAPRISRARSYGNTYSHELPAGALPRHFGIPAFGVTPLQSQALVPEYLADVSPSESVEFDEGGLVELFAVAAMEKAPAARVSNAASAISGSIDAEVGLFQTIDVASSLVGDPSHAALSPFILVIVFQLFDQRRKVDASDDRARL